MTYKGTGWTRGDLGNVPDRNPWIECNGCDRRERYQSLKDDDWEDWQKPSDPDVPLLCPECKDGSVGVKSVEERRKSNRSITEWAE